MLMPWLHREYSFQPWVLSLHPSICLSPLCSCSFTSLPWEGLEKSWLNCSPDVCVCVWEECLLGEEISWQSCGSLGQELELKLSTWREIVVRIIYWVVAGSWSTKCCPTLSQFCGKPALLLSPGTWCIILQRGFNCSFFGFGWITVSMLMSQLPLFLTAGCTHDQKWNAPARYSFHRPGSVVSGPVF